MNDTFLTIKLDPEEAEALNRMSRAEYRRPKEQVRFIIRQELVRRGFFQDAQTQTDCEKLPQNVQGS
jgi:hypothetical protein